MMKAEFDKLVGLTTSPESYERIEFVYMNSGFFSNKQQIADFYKAQDMNGIERLYKEIVKQFEQKEALQMEINSLKVEIAAIQRPVEAAQITDELVDDLAIFSETYIERIRVAIIQNAGQIAKNATLVHLLHEYAVRLTSERRNYARSVMDAVKHGAEFHQNSNILTHANSYRQVIEDLLRPYWE